MKYVQGRDTVPAAAAAREGSSCVSAPAGAVYRRLFAVYQAGREEGGAWALGRMAVPPEDGGT